MLRTNSLNETKEASSKHVPRRSSIINRANSAAGSLPSSVINKFKKKKLIKMNLPIDLEETSRAAAQESLVNFQNVIQEKRQIFNNPTLFQNAKDSRICREQTRLSKIKCLSTFLGDEEIFELGPPKSLEVIFKRIPFQFEPSLSTKHTIISPYFSEESKNDLNQIFSKEEPQLETENSEKGYPEEEIDSSNDLKSLQSWEDEEILKDFDMFESQGIGSVTIHRSNSIVNANSSLEDRSNDGILRDENYFGKEARYNFFALFKSLSKKGESHELSPNNRPASANHIVSTWQSVMPRPSSAQHGHRNALTPARHPSMLKSMKSVDPLSPFDTEQIRSKSPRTRFIQYIINDPKKLAPLPLILRHNLDDIELNLAHRSLGDDYICYLSEVVAELPKLSKVNLRDNRLTDNGMGKFIQSLAKQSHITSIDLSENKIDSTTAEALTHYLRSSSCSLTILSLSNADVDDDEAAIFMEALEINKSITELDMSHNKLGGIGEKNLSGSQLSGGAAIAKALRNNQKLKSLDLSWNKLGPSSASHLGESVYSNHYLTELNLAYNRIRDDGAEAIGNALTTNSSLTKLNISYNGIGAIGTMVLAFGLRINKFLRVLDLSGNPICERGGNAIMQSLNYHSVERTILLNDCSFEESHNISSTDHINLAYPTGKFTLDLSKPRQRCIMVELYWKASMTRGCIITGIVHTSSTSGGKKRNTPLKKTPITLVRKENPASVMGQPYGPWKCSFPRPRHSYTLLEANDWMARKALLSLINTATGEPWIIPESGTITFEIKYVPRCPTPIECLNATGLERLIKLIKMHPKEFLKILKLCHNLIIESYQLEEIMNFVIEQGRSKDISEVFALLIICVRDTSNVPTLIESFPEVSDSLKDVQILTRSLFYISVNAISGHYTLDLDNSYDRIAGVRLMEISADENEYIRHAVPTWNTSYHGYTSQKFNKNNFRNERYRRSLIYRGVNDDFFCHGLEDKIPGVLEFDFVSTTRPAENVIPIHWVKLEKLLISKKLLNVNESNFSLRTKKSKRRLHIALAQSLSGILTSSNESTSQNKTEEIHPELLASAKQREVSVESERAKKEKSDISAAIGQYILDFEGRITKGSIEDSSLAMKGFENLKSDDIENMTSEIYSDSAMFFIENENIYRYTMTAQIRILNSTGSEHIFQNIACIKKHSDKYELIGFGETMKTPILDILNLESENSVFEIGIVPNVNTEALSSTHKKYIISDDYQIVGSDIHLKVKSCDWSMITIEDRAIEALVRAFSCHAINLNTIKILQHKVTDMKNTEFSGYKYSSPISSRYIVHQIDVNIEGLPIDVNILLKSYMSTSKSIIIEDAGSVVNTVWMWRTKQNGDRIIPKVDWNTYSMEFWGNRIMTLKSTISSLWLTCEEAIRIALEFPIFGYDAQPHRQSVVVALFSRIIDLENFDQLISTLPSYCHVDIYNRLGWLNAINPYFLEKTFTLDLEIEDNRLLMNMIGKFAAVEPGNNFLDPRYRRTKSDLFVPGWSLPASWISDPPEGGKTKALDVIPRKGQVVVTYTASSEHGCKLVPQIRKLYCDKFFLLNVPRGLSEDYHLKDNSEIEWNDLLFSSTIRS